MLAQAPGVASTQDDQKRTAPVQQPYHYSTQRALQSAYAANRFLISHRQTPSEKLSQYKKKKMTATGKRVGDANSAVYIIQPCQNLNSSLPSSAISGIVISIRSKLSWMWSARRSDSRISRRSSSVGSNSTGFVE